MKKILFGCFLLLPSLFLSAQDTSFIYGDMHAMGGYPMLGLGVRTQQGKHALDVSASFLSLDIFHAKGQYLIYPNQNGFYLGAGLGMLKEVESIRGITGSAEGALGYQWDTSTNKHVFFEVNGIVPFQKSDVVSRVWPGLSLGFGF